MNHIENRDEAAHSRDAEYERPGENLLAQIIHIFALYKYAILFSLLAVLATYCAAAIAVYIFTPSQPITTLPFRLDFRGAPDGQYPNGTKFSTADITATPVMLRVFKENDLGRYGSYEDFTRSFFILESNRALEQLAIQYQAKLADLKLSPIDRDRIEKEYELKRASISANVFSINFTPYRDGTRIPPAIVRHLLENILTTWARVAVAERKVMLVEVKVLSPSIVDDVSHLPETVLSLAQLRSKVEEVIGNIHELKTIAGVAMIRSTRSHISLDELSLSMNDLLRFRLEPAIALAAATVKNRPFALSMLQAQYAHDQRMLATEREQEEALRRAFDLYDKDRSVRTMPQTTATATVSRPAESGGVNGETVQPQVSESFIDRIVDLTNAGADRQYKQRFIQDIRAVALSAVPDASTVAFDEKLIEAVTHPPSVPASADVNAFVQSSITDATTTVRHAIEEMNDIYLNASKQLNPATELYTLTDPPTTRVDRSVSLTKLALLGVLVTLVSIPLIFIGCLLHLRLRAEQHELDEAA
jgi:hypothetical protein